MPQSIHGSMSFVGVLLSVAIARAETPLRDLVDAAIERAWQRQEITPAQPSTDGIFLRRVYLDLLGTIPTYDEAKAFLDDTTADKRQRLIDRLLEDPRYAAHQADVWDLMLFGREPPGYQTDQRDGFQRWLRERFATNTPYDEWARAILKAEGNTVDDGPPMYLMQYKNNPEDAAEAVSQEFLGVQLQCSRCHDHPYEGWTQKDFYGMAAFFARLDVVQVGKKDNLTKYVIGEKNRGEVMFTGPASEQEPGKKGEPIPAKFLLGDAIEEPALPEDFEEPRNFPSGKAPPAPKFSRKDKLAHWATAADNPYFARAVANRVWAQFMGRGLVHPVDNMSESNAASHPELLDALAIAIVEHKFDLKWYIRELVNTRTYGLGHGGDSTAALPAWFERAKVRPLSAEELVEAWRKATSLLAADKRTAERLEKDRYAPLGSGYMLRFFGKPNNGVGDFQGGLHEHLYLNNGPVTGLISYNEGGLHHSLMNMEEPWPERVERLFLSVLSRRPTEEETGKFVEYVSSEENSADRLKEAIWVLLTSSEFRFNH